MSNYTAEDERLIDAAYEKLLESCKKTCKGEESWNKIKRAYFLAKEAHAGVRRRSGEPYMLHPIAVAQIAVDEIGLGAKSVIAALLHDVVEDTDYTLEDLAQMGFSKTIMDAIALMTHADGVDYMDYVRAIRENPIAKAVKLADLRHNSDLTRMDVVDEKVLERRKVYLEALALLGE
jgi:GTP pyrophosphokinase